MKSAKIKEFKARGLRGFKNEVVLPLNEKSIVLYGENGTGKSSVADIIEWFFSDRINHLSDIEIGRNGLEAMRHTSLTNNENGAFTIRFKDSKFDCEKTLYLKKGVVNHSVTNCTEAFDKYISDSKKEKLVIHYKELSGFVVATQGERLTQLSEIIGFSEVTEIKRLLNRIHNKLEKEIKTSGFERIIQSNQQTLIRHLNQNVVSDQQFLSVINAQIKNHTHEKVINELKEIPEFISSLMVPVDQVKLTTIALCSELKNCLIHLEESIKVIYSDYEKAITKYNKLVDDAKSLNDLKLTDLLSTGEKILSVDTENINSCPLCLSDINGLKILENVRERLFGLNEIKAKKLEITKSLIDIFNNAEVELQKLRSGVSNPLFKEKHLADIRAECILIGIDVKKLVDEINKRDFENKLKANLNLQSQTLYLSVKQKIDTVVLEIENSLPKDSNTELVVKLQESVNAYNEIISQKRLSSIIEAQKASFAILSEEFAKIQKNSLDEFFKMFSQSINEYYVYMNPNESVENIRLMPIESEDEIKGLTIQFEFFDQEVTPPHKFLSESHLNCLGLSFFLASVVAFNKTNKFFVLDDVISSFDTNHRKRFLDLLVERFKEYQIILLTHETNFFEYARRIAKTNNWLVESFRFSKENGTYLTEPRQSIFEKIIKKLNNGDDDKLGHDIRVYLEHFAKEVANCIEAKVSFKYNDVNEDRMAPELLNEIKSRIIRSSKGNGGLLNIAGTILNRTLASQFIGNKDSHDSKFIPSFGDCKAFWNDVIELELIFKCRYCTTILNRKYYTTDTKEIKCRCGKLSYPWQD